MHNYNVGIFIYKVFMRLDYNLCNQVCKCMNNFLLLKDMVNVKKSWYDFCLYFKTHGNNFIILLIYIVQQTICDIWDCTEFNRSQNHLNHIYFVSKKFENIIFQSMKTPQNATMKECKIEHFGLPRKYGWLKYW